MLHQLNSLLRRLNFFMLVNHVPTFYNVALMIPVDHAFDAPIHFRCNTFLFLYANPMVSL